MVENRRTDRRAVHKGKERFSFIWVALLLCAALLMVLSGCQEQARSTQAVSADGGAISTGDGPRITMEKTLHDFGEIGPGTSQKGEFRFTNTGNAPLIITRVATCCGVVTKGVRDGQRYAPGRGGVLELEYQAPSVPGDMKRNLYIYCNDPNQNMVSLTVQAKIMRRIDVAPANLRLFLKRENAGAESITLTSLDGRPFAITDFRATGNTITADFDPTVEATEFVLIPKVNLERIERNLRGQVRIELTHPECKDVTVLYDVLPEFTVAPPQLMLFNLEPGKAVRREIWVLGNYEEDFEIESVSSQKGLVGLVETERVKGAARDWMPGVEEDRVITRYKVVVEIAPPDENIGAVLSDVLEIKIQGGEMIQITCRGFYAGN